MTKSNWKKDGTTWIHKSGLYEIHRCEREETDDYGPAGEVWWISVETADRQYGYSDPYYQLWACKEDVENFIAKRTE